MAKNELTADVALIRIAYTLLDPFPELELSESVAETIRLAAFGFTNDEIAEKTNVSTSTVGTRLWRVKARFGKSKRELTNDLIDQIQRTVDLVDPLAIMPAK